MSESKEAPIVSVYLESSGKGWWGYVVGCWLRGRSVKGQFRTDPFCGWDR